MVSSRAVHRSPSSGSRVAFQVPSPEDLVAASRECLEGVLDELNTIALASTGRGSPDRETGSLNPSPSKTSQDHRVSFGITSVSEQKLPISRERSPVAGAAGAMYSGVRTPPKERPMTDEFDVSMIGEVDVILDDDDDMLDPEERARRRRSSGASGTSAISEELDAPRIRWPGEAAAGTALRDAFAPGREPARCRCKPKGRGDEPELRRWQMQHRGFVGRRG
ncbi:hypothetical protein MRX96_041132 [Rhipicephalus microplus]